MTITTTNLDPSNPHDGAMDDTPHQGTTRRD